MLAVNLLPWRAQQWQRRRKLSISWLAFTLGCALLLLLALWGRGVRLQHQQVETLAVITQTLTGLQQQLAEQKTLLQRRDELQQLKREQQRRQMQHLHWQDFWLRLPALMPDTLWLQRAERRQMQLLLEGQAQSMAAVRDFRQQLLTQPLFSAVRQGSVQRLPGGDYRFTLFARLQEMVDE